jgi:hypothetical protein
MLDKKIKEMKSQHEQALCKIEGELMSQKMKQQSTKADHLEEKHNFNQVM